MSSKELSPLSPEKLLILKPGAWTVDIIFTACLTLPDTFEGGHLLPPIKPGKFVG